MHRLHHSITRCVAPSLCLLAAFTSASNAQCEYTITSPTYWHPLAPYQEIHADIESDGTTIAINCGGAAFLGHPYHGRPAVITFQNIDGQWTDEQFIPCPEGLYASQFGREIAIRGDRMVIAAPNLGWQSVDGRGRLYYYEREDGLWHLRQEINMPDLLSNNFFGRQLEMSDTQIFATIERTFAMGPQILRGIVVLEQDESGEWNINDVIENPSGNPSDLFSASMTYHDGNLVVGAPEVPGPTAELNGLIYVLHQIDGAWMVDTTIAPCDPEEHLFGGEGTTFSGDTIAAMTPDSHLTIYERNQQGHWSHAGLMQLPCVVEGEYCGIMLKAIDVRDDLITVCSSANSGRQGALHVIRKVDQVWTADAPVRPAEFWGDQLPFDGYGKRQAIDGFGLDVCITDSGIHVLSSVSRQDGDNRPPCIVTYDSEDNVGRDQNNNGICDAIDFINGTLGHDYDLSGYEDAWEIANGLAQDCDEDGIPDSVQLDCDGDGIPDVCEPDCNDNGIPDGCESLFDALPMTTTSDEAFRPSQVHHTVGLAAFVIQPGGETINQVTIRRGGVYDGANSRIVIYRDPDNDLDPINAELVFIKDITREAQTKHSGVTVAIPDVHVGEPGEVVYIGFASSPMRPNEFPFAGSFLPESDPLMGLWMIGWHTDPNVGPPIDFSSFDTSSYFVYSSTRRLDINAHFGPRKSCCASADLNHDGTIDIDDLLTILSDWGSCNNQCAADTNGDITIDCTDLLHVISHWGDCN